MDASVTPTLSKGKIPMKWYENIDQNVLYLVYRIRDEQNIIINDHLRMVLWAYNSIRLILLLIGVVPVMWMILFGILIQNLILGMVVPFCYVFGCFLPCVGIIMFFIIPCSLDSRPTLNATQHYVVDALLLYSTTTGLERDYRYDY